VLWAKLRLDADGISQVQQFSFPHARVGATEGQQGGVGGVEVWPQGTDDRCRLRGLQQRPHHAPGQQVLAIQIALQLIEPHDRPWHQRSR
jgi:hypothetical protein